MSLNEFRLFMILVSKLDSLHVPTSATFHLAGQIIKNPPAMWETWVRSLGWEGPLEKGKATLSSILAWRISIDRGAWRATVHEVAKSRTPLSN